MNAAIGSAVPSVARRASPGAARVATALPRAGDRPAPRSKVLAANPGIEVQSDGSDPGLTVGYAGNTQAKGLFARWGAKQAQMKARVAQYGSAAVLAYGLIDAITYTSFFCFALITYQAKMGAPPQTVKQVAAVVLAMWAGNNVTRPFRVAGAAILAPAVSRLLKAITKRFNLPNTGVAFAGVVAATAATSIAIVAALWLSLVGA
ncbi:unnamed protein product [Pedinophyceae sp. YPF-701]|nr:unnamed protein product [Pedinophyceae sp. YPF-701]